MTENEANEHVLVFPVSALNEVGTFQGINWNLSKYLPAISKKQLFMPRGEAESDYNFKQIISYSIITYDTAILRYARGTLLSEKRLESKYSIGIGGHISVDDPSLFAPDYEQGMLRELNEELKIETKYEYKAIALLNDDTNDVGRVHFGIVFMVELAAPKVAKREKSIKDMKFVSIANLRKNISKFENWSQICIDNYESILRQS